MNPGNIPRISAMFIIEMCIRDRNNEMYVGEKIGNIASYRNLKSLLKESRRVILVNDGGKVQLVLYPGKKFGNNVYATIDVAFPIVHGTNVEDGVFQGYLQTIGVPYVGCDVISSAVGMDLSLIHI